MQVLNDEPPLPPQGQFSDDLRDFIHQCLAKDPYKRPSAEALMQHPFITSHLHENIDLQAFMQCMFDPLEK